MTERKEEKLWQALTTPLPELPEEENLDVKADLAAAPPLEPALRDRLLAAAFEQLEKDAATAAAMPVARRSEEVETPARPPVVATRPSSPRRRPAGPRWWRRPLWLATWAISAAVITAVVVAGPGRLGGRGASFPVYRLEVDEYSNVLGMNPAGTPPDSPERERMLSQRASLSAILRAVRVGTQEVGVKAWIAQGGRLAPWPVEVKLAPGHAVVRLDSLAPLGDVAVAGEKVGLGSAMLLVVVGDPAGLPSDAEVAAAMREGAAVPQGWHLLRQAIRVVP